jgi:hypothetical protein
MKRMRRTFFGLAVATGVMLAAGLLARTRLRGLPGRLAGRAADAFASVLDRLPESFPSKRILASLDVIRRQNDRILHQNEQIYRQNESILAILRAQRVPAELSYNRSGRDCPHI